jgi:hypothetical protein
VSADSGAWQIRELVRLAIAAHDLLRLRFPARTIVMITDVSQTPAFGYNPPMRRALRSIAHLLVALLLATVLSPSFAWEAIAGQAAHGHDIVVLDGSDDVHDQDNHASSHNDDEDSHHHHGCAGHFLGHLPAHVGEAFVVAMLDPARDGFPEPAADFSSPFPDRLDRPPLARALA